MVLTLCILLCLTLYPYHTRSQRLDQRDFEKTVKMATAVKLTCSYSEVSSPFYFFWYQQLPSKPPVYLLQRTYLGDNFQAPGTEGFFSSFLDSNAQEMHLLLSSARPNDAATYLCAVNHKSEKRLQFTNGTRLSVLPERETRMSAYLLRTKQDRMTACVVNNVHPGASTISLSGERVLLEPTIAHGEFNYGMVAVSPDGATTCSVRQDGEEVTAAFDEGQRCIFELDFETDEKLNTLFVTVLVLRIVLIKCVVLSGCVTFLLFPKWIVSP